MRLKVLIAVTVTIVLLALAGCKSSPGNVLTPVTTYAEWNFDYLTIKYDGAGHQIWAARYNGPGNNVDSAAAVAVDDNGYVYVTGVSHGIRGNGIREDYATIKYDGNGNEIWVARYEGPGGGDISARALAVDGDGNVYVSGNYATIKYDSSGNELWVARNDESGASFFGIDGLALDSEGNLYITGHGRGDGGHDDYVTLKYDNNGNRMWLTRYENGSPTTLAVDSAGNVYVTGVSRAGEGLHFATVKYNTTGSQLWETVYNGLADRDDVPYGLAVDDMGNVAVSGRSRSPDEKYDYETVKYDRHGNELWAARYNGPAGGSDQATSLEFDAEGNLYVTGSSNNENRDREYATIKYDRDGKLLWETRYSGQGGDNMIKTLALDADGNVLIAGQSQGNNSGWDYAVVKYNDKGKQLWAARYNGPGNNTDEITDLTVDSQGNVYVTGRSAGTAGTPIIDQSPYYRVPSYNVPGQTIQTKVGEEFAFGFNTVTRLNQQWQETYDGDMVSLMERELVMNQTSGLISGTTWFLFKALKPGETSVTFESRQTGLIEFRVLIR